MLPLERHQIQGQRPGRPWPGIIRTAADPTFTARPIVVEVPIAARKIAMRYNVPIATATAIAGLAGFREKPS